MTHQIRFFEDDNGTDTGYFVLKENRGVEKTVTETWGWTGYVIDELLVKISVVLDKQWQIQ